MAKSNGKSKKVAKFEYTDNVLVTEYNGNKILKFSDDPEARFATQMGARKLIDVLDNMEDVLTFLREHGKEKGEEAVERFLENYGE